MSQAPEQPKPVESQAPEQPKPVDRNAFIWNGMCLFLSILILAFGASLMFCTPTLLNDVIQKQGVQIIVITVTLPVVAFLLAMEKIPKEAGLSLLGAIIGYAFGKG